MNRKLYFLIAAIAIVILSSILVVTNGDKCNTSLACSRLTKFKGEEYHRVVSKKYLDQKNHRFKTIEFREGDPIVLARDTSSFFDFIQPEDSLVKIQGSDTLSVYRRNSIYKFEIYFGCPD